MNAMQMRDWIFHAEHSENLGVWELRECVE